MPSLEKKVIVGSLGLAFLCFVGVLSCLAALLPTTTTTWKGLLLMGGFTAFVVLFYCLFHVVADVQQALHEREADDLASERQVEPR